MNNKYVYLGLTLMIAACSSEQEPDAAVTPTPSTQAAKLAIANDPTARMASAVGAGKPGAAVNLKYDFLAKPAVGVPVDVDLAFIPNAGVNSMDIVIGGMDGLSLTGDMNATFSDVKAGQVYKNHFSLLANKEGVFYLTVAATTRIGNTSMGRTFSVPFVVGTPAPVQKPTPPPKDATGQPVQSMPAQETSK